MVGIRSFPIGFRPIWRGELAVSFREIDIPASILHTSVTIPPVLKQCCPDPKKSSSNLWKTCFRCEWKLWGYWVWTKNTAKVRGFPLLSNFHWIFLWFQRFLVGHHDLITKLQKVSSYKKNFPTKTHQRKLQLPHNKWPYKWVSGVITPINQCCNFLRTTFPFHHTQNRSLPSSGPPCGVLAASENMCPPKKRLLFLKRKGTCLLVWSFIMFFWGAMLS